MLKGCHGSTGGKGLRRWKERDCRAEGKGGTGKRSVLYLATAIPIDDDMKERIRMHQERRDPEWGTYEGYRDLGEVVKNTEKNTILLDCVTVMITNIFVRRRGERFR